MFKLAIAALSVLTQAQKCDAAAAGAGLCEVNCVGVECLEVVEKTVPAVLCSAGFIYEEEEGCCVMDEETDPLFVCPDGTVPEDFNCSRTSRPVMTCDADYDLVDGACVRRSKATMDASCPPGSILDGMSCAEKVPVDLVPECPENCFGEGDKCFTNQSYRHSFVCPAGWLLDGGRCVLEEIVDCTEIELPGDCGEHCYVDMQCTGGNDSCYGSKDVIEQRIKARKDKRFLTANGAMSDVCNAQPCKVVKMTKSRPDTSSMEMISRTCLKRTETDAEVFCDGPAEAVFNGKECCMKVPVPSVYKCPVSQFGSNDSDCFTIRRLAPQYVCPASFERVCNGSRVSPARCECVAVEEIPATPVCPEDSHFTGEECLAYDEPIAYCADSGAMLVQGMYCVRTVREPVRLRTSVTLECLGSQCFEKVNAELSRKNLLPELEFSEEEEPEDVEIVMNRPPRRRGRICDACAARMQVVDKL